MNAGSFSKLILVGATLLASAGAHGGTDDDLVWQNRTGKVHFWPIQGGESQDGKDLATARPGMRLRGIGDVDGRGHDDIVWRRRGARVYLWSVEDGRRTSMKRLGRAGPEWALRGVGNVDGRGHDDLVWQRNDGQVHYWSMRSGRRTTTGNIGEPVSSEWTLRGVGDVDGRGDADLVWQHDSGRIHYWSIERGKIVDKGNIGNSSRPLRAVGNVDGRGDDDLIWQRSNGQVYYWAVDGGRRRGSGTIGSPTGSQWSLRGAGDVDDAQRRTVRKMARPTVSARSVVTSKSESSSKGESSSSSESGSSPGNGPWRLAGGTPKVSVRAGGGPTDRAIRRGFSDAYLVRLGIKENGDRPCMMWGLAQQLGKRNLKTLSYRSDCGRRNNSGEYASTAGRAVVAADVCLNKKAKRKNARVKGLRLKALRLRELMDPNADHDGLMVVDSFSRPNCRHWQRTSCPEGHVATGVIITERLRRKSWINGLRLLCRKVERK